MNTLETDPSYIFAEDLMMFVMKGYDLPYNRPETRVRIVPLRFVPCVGHVVRYLGSLQEEKTLAAFDFLRCNVLSGEHYDEFSLGMVESHFNGDFQMLDFLCFCAQITRLAVLFYTNHIMDAPQRTVNAIAMSLRKEHKNFVAHGGWDQLYDVCFYILHKIPRRQRCKSPKKAEE